MFRVIDLIMCRLSTSSWGIERAHVSEGLKPLYSGSGDANGVVMGVSQTVHLYDEDLLMGRL